MPFNTIPFLIFFLLFTIVYYLAPKRIKSGLLLVGSYVFYSYTGIQNLVFLLLITGVTYVVAQQIRKERRGRVSLTLGIISIVILLVAAKYAPVFFGPFSHLEDSFFINIVVPLGISFYSLQAISLLIDVYRSPYRHVPTLQNTSLYLSFFPQAASGPLHRANELIPQFGKAGMFIPNNLVVGIKIMIYGYFCKLIIADKISLVITPVFHAWENFDGFSLFAAMLLNSFQIYFDFLGYSLIAIGVGRILGFKININFLAPYRAMSFKEFWHRWHITLSRWMRDYIYIPLGGNQAGYILFWVAISTTFLVSGLWHGVTSNFLLWGAVHASLYLVEETLRLLMKRLGYYCHLNRFLRMFRALRWSVFFLIISLTWLIFRTESMQDLDGMVCKIFSVRSWSVHAAYDYYVSGIIGIYLIIISLAFIIAQAFFNILTIQLRPLQKHRSLLESFLICICLFAVILLGDMGSQEFLYFKF
jgi:alginate O-acetyltransferase complex protein AlgI